MSIPWGDLAVRILNPAAPAVETSPSPSELEAEIIDLFDQFRGRLLRYTLAFGLPPQDGEEIVQEVFLALFCHLRRGRSRRNLRGWIFRVAHNLALKRRQVNHRVQDRVTSDEGVATRQLDPGLNPEEEMMGSQRQEKLLAILRALPQQDQCCLYLRAEGLTYREIAEVLAMSLGGVSISLTKSLARFRRADEVQYHAE
jgi:RNA polymerase sigma-70 factor (ECF subfamily)